MSQLSRVFERINAEEVVELTRALSAFRACYRPGEAGANEAAVAAFVRILVQACGLPRQGSGKVAPGRPNVLWRGSARRGRGGAAFFSRATPTS